MATKRNGFTLTELLVVIAIIAVLVALVSTGVMVAMGRAKATRIKTELDQIDMALRSFKETYGAYPPADLRIGDPTTLAKVRQFVATAFPRYDLADLEPDLKAALGTGGADPNFRPDQALVLWLRGFNSDPTHPFVTRDDFPLDSGTAGTTKVARKPPYFEFDTARLVGVDDTGVQSAVVMPSYFPQGRPPNESAAPYVYWDYRSYGDPSPDPGPRETQFNTTKTTGGVMPFISAGTAAPYAVDNDGTPGAEAWHNADSFQLISSGVDGKYGVSDADTTLNTKARIFPNAGTTWEQKERRDDDNATNFNSTAKIGDALP